MSKPAIQSSDCYYTIPPPATGPVLLEIFLLQVFMRIFAVLALLVTIVPIFFGLAMLKPLLQDIRLRAVMDVPCVASQNFSNCVFFLPYSKLKIREIILVRPDVMAFEYFSNDLSLRSERFESTASNSPNEKRSSGQSLK